MLAIPDRESVDLWKVVSGQKRCRRICRDRQTLRPLYSGRCTGSSKPQRAALLAGVSSEQIGSRALALVGVLGMRDHLSPGRAESHGFEYKRNGTLSLFAALNTSTGEVLGKTQASPHQ